MVLFGGEEFVVLLGGATVEVAVRRAEELREAIAALGCRHGDTALPQVTVSVGVAAVPLHADTPEALVGAADAALYEAKQSGRNRVCVARGRARASA